jgi:hypothetical protein
MLVSQMCFEEWTQSHACAFRWSLYRTMCGHIGFAHPRWFRVPLSASARPRASGLTDMLPATKSDQKLDMAPERF